MASVERNGGVSSPTATIDQSPWGVLLAGSIFVATLAAALQVNDLAYHIRLGRWIWATGLLPRHDFLTYTIPGAPWIDQQWGAQLLFAGITGLGGWHAIAIAHAVIVAGCYVAVYRVTRRCGASAIVGGVTCAAGYVAAALMPGALAMRPQLLALPLLLLSAWIIRARAAHPMRLNLLVPIGIAWANLHGSFPLLTIMLLIASIDDVVSKAPTRTRTLALLSASVVTPLLSPFGVNTYRHVWDVATSPLIREISEWGPIWTRVPAGPVFLLLIVFSILAVRRRGTRNPTLEEGLTLVVFTGLALWSGRNIIWWSVLVPTIVGALLAGWDPGGSWSGRTVRVITIATASVASLATVATLTRDASSLLTEAPQGVTAALAASPPSGHIFNEWWGSWFEYALPDRPVFTDARVEVFPATVWNDYFTVVDAAPGWSDTLRGWSVTTVVVNLDHQLPLVAVLDRDPCWELAYQDDEGAVYRLKPGCA